MVNSRRIGLLGATGYTGKLVAAELARRGIPHRLGARNADRLGALPTSPDAEPFIVDAGDPARLRDFCTGIDAVISTVGPFIKYGLPVVEAVAAAGIPYVDSTGEHAFMAEVYDRFADSAAPVVPACGFDYIPGDLAAAIAASNLPGLAREIRVAYGVHGGRPSRGTALSAIGIVGSMSIRPRALQINAGDESLSAIELPWGEQLTVPLHRPMGRVTTGVLVPPRPARVIGAVSPLGPAVRPVFTVAKPLLERLANRLPEGPTEAVRSAATYRVVAEAIGDGGAARSVVIEGRDPYALTARLLVEAALRAEGKGALAPAQALDPAPFLDAVSGDLLRWTLH
jgi:short subunit dehydrogenase-like uncharacterized protein